MNTEKQRIAIAGACGWTDIQRGPYDGSPFGRHKTHQLEMIPNYLNDLNAMHEAEKVLTVGQRIEYVREIGFIFTGRNDRAVPDWWLIHEADAQQRAEAFLRTIGKWEEEA